MSIYCLSFVFQSKHSYGDLLIANEFVLETQDNTGFFLNSVISRMLIMLS